MPGEKAGCRDPRECAEQPIPQHLHDEGRSGLASLLVFLLWLGIANLRGAMIGAVTQTKMMLMLILH